MYNVQYTLYIAHIIIYTIIKLTFLYFCIAVAFCLSCEFSFCNFSTTRFMALITRSRSAGDWLEFLAIVFGFVLPEGKLVLIIIKLHYVLYHILCNITSYSAFYNLILYAMLY